MVQRIPNNATTTTDVDRRTTELADRRHRFPERRQHTADDVANRHGH